MKIHARKASGGGAASSTASGRVAVDAGGTVTVPGSNLPYFGAGGRILSKPVKAPPPVIVEKPLLLTIYSRVSSMIPFDSPFAPLAGDLLLYVGRPKVGAVFGYSNIDGFEGFTIGVSGFRYNEAPQVFDIDGLKGWVLIPTLDATLSLFPDWGGGFGVNLAVATELTGFRVMKCFGKYGLVGELRGPRIGLGLAGPAAGDPIPYIAAGAAMSVGMAF